MAMQRAKKQFRFPKEIRRGSAVVVISGNAKGKRSKIIEVLRSKQRVIVEGVALVKRHLKKSRANPEGGIAERESSIHVSNVMLVERYDARQSKKTAGKAKA